MNLSGVITQIEEHPFVCDPQKAHRPIATSASMAAVKSQSIDRSKLGVAVRETHEDPGSMAMMCCDLGFGKQTTFFQEEVALSAEPIISPFRH